MGSHYDYTHQAWTVDGRYVRCGHAGNCTCYGMAHEGEIANVNDLPTANAGAYYLTLSANGMRTQKVRVFNSETAVTVFEDFRDRGDYGFSFGSSQLKSDCGKVTDANNKHIATICYNGRVKLPNGTFLDGLNAGEWLECRTSA